MFACQIRLGPEYPVKAYLPPSMLACGHAAAREACGNYRLDRHVVTGRSTGRPRRVIREGRQPHENSEKRAWSCSTAAMRCSCSGISGNAARTGCSPVAKSGKGRAQRPARCGRKEGSAACRSVRCSGPVAHPVAKEEKRISTRNQWWSPAAIQALRDRFHLERLADLLLSAVENQISPSPLSRPKSSRSGLPGPSH